MLSPTTLLDLWAASNGSPFFDYMVGDKYMKIKKLCEKIINKIKNINGCTN